MDNQFYTSTRGLTRKGVQRGDQNFSLRPQITESVSKITYMCLYGYNLT